MAVTRRRLPVPEKEEPIVQVNGWSIYAHPLFIDQFEELLEEVEKLRKENPENYREKKKTKLLAAIVEMAFERIPGDPSSPAFRQGNTLGAAHRNWSRGKFFAGRFRLFFRYDTKAKIIVLAWVNDEDTLRTYGSKTDAYAVFRKMIEKGNPPGDWEALLGAAKKAGLQAKKVVERGKKAE